MNTNFRGNYGAYYRNSNATQGIGKQQRNRAVGNVSVIAQEAGEFYVSASSIMCLKYDQGGCLQATGSDVEVSFTCEPADFATDKQANEKGLVHWCNTLTVKTDTIEAFPIPAFSALKAKFSAPGILYIVTR